MIGYLPFCHSKFLYDNNINFRLNETFIFYNLFHIFKFYYFEKEIIKITTSFSVEVFTWNYLLINDYIYIDLVNLQNFIYFYNIFK